MTEECCKICGGLKSTDEDLSPTLLCDCPFIPLQEEEEDDETEWEE